MRIKIDSLAHLPLVGLSQSDLFMLKRKLIVIPKADSFNPNPSPIVLYKLSDKHISIPREYFFQNSHQEHELVWTYSSGHPLSKLTPIKLRDQQVLVVCDYIRHLKEGRSLGGIVSAQTGCLSGDTVIKVNRGGSCCTYTLEQLCLRYDDDYRKQKKIYMKDGRILNRKYKITSLCQVRSFDGESIKLKPFEKVVFSGVKSVYELKLVNGFTIKATLDHKIQTKKEMIPLGILMEGVDEVMCDSLLPVKAHAAKGKDHDSYFSGMIYHPHATSKKLKRRRDCYRISKSKAIYESYLNKISLSSYIENCRNGVDIDKMTFVDSSIHHIHHIDGNHQNNDLGNLQLLSLSDHCKIHGDYKNFNQGIPTYSVVESIRYVGEKETFDIVEVEKNHNFVANGIVVSNSGKTVMALDIARKLGMTTLIKVYKEDLLLQWRDRIKEFYPEAKIGIIQGNICDYKGKDFVIAMIQTLLSRREQIDANEELSKYFGFEITDEIHRFGSKEWGSTADIFPCKYRLGLSATVRRKDKCEDVFYYHIGKIVTKSEIKVLTPEVFFRDTGFSPRGDRSIDHLPMSTQLKILAGNIYRNKVIVLYIVRAIVANRKVLVLSKFVDHLQKLEQLTKMLMSNMESQHENLKSKKVGFYVGALYTGEVRQNQKGETIRIKRDVTKEELDEARKADCIFASYKMAEDAFDQPDIDTLFMALPISDPQQSIGRILRLHNGKQKPVVMDLCDENVSFCSHLKNSRLKFYIHQGWPIKAIKS